MINFDFPTSIVDYIHRVGRTGRVKTEVTRKGVSIATSLLTHNRDVRMAKTIEVSSYVFQIYSTRPIAYIITSAADRRAGRLFAFPSEFCKRF